MIPQSPSARVPQSPSARRRRAPWLAALVLAAFWIGLVAGTVLGAVFFVPAGSGLAGPAIALGYGIAGALAGAVLAGMLGRRLPTRLLRRTAVTAMVLGAGAALAVGYRFVVQQAERRADRAAPPPEVGTWRLDLRRDARLS